MAIPRVFVSSTCYDLKYIRENLKYFIKTLGYDPVLSEEGSVYYDPTLDTQDSCLREIPSCQMFVLIIGGRFGETYKGTEKSITNSEYQEAVRSKIPVFALVESSVLSEYFLYRKNRDNKNIDEKKIDYPSVDSIKIFNFIDDVRTNSINNALVPFSDFSGIESYLRQQWAGMMYSFLTRQNEDKRVADTLSALTQISEKVEFLSTQILKSVGSDEAKLMSELYDEMFEEGILITAFAGAYRKKISPKNVLENAEFDDFIKTYDISWYYRLKEANQKRMRLSYQDLRERMIRVLENHKISLEDFLSR